MPTEAQRIRMLAYMDALRPHVSDLRRRGWPVEVEVRIEESTPVVVASLNVDDTHVPVESISIQGVDD
jgi:hypothetical protein